MSELEILKGSAAGGALAAEASQHGRSLKDFSYLPPAHDKDARNHVVQESGANDQLARPNLIRRLAWAYILCMALVIMLSLTGQIIVTVVSERNHGDGRVVNVAGRQRMWSQIIAKDALAFEHWQGNSSAQAAYSSELNEALKNWQYYHVGLLEGTDSLPGTKDSTIRELFAQIEPVFQGMYGAAVQVLRLTDRENSTSALKAPAPGTDSCVALKDCVAIILMNEPVYLLLMNEIVQRYQSIGEDHLKVLLIITWVITGVVVGTLLLEGFFVMRPALKKTQISLSERFDLLRASLEAEAGARSVSMLMVGYVAHELLGPLGSIQRNLKFMQTRLKQFPALYGGTAGGPLEQACKTIQDIVRDSQATCSMMATVVNDVVDMRRLEAGQLALLMAPVDVATCAKQVASMVKPQLGVSVKCDLDPAVQGKRFVTDSHRLTQVLMNLLNNAVSFTQAGTVTLRCLYIDQRLRFEVVDTGEGMSEEACAKAFMPFIGAPTYKEAPLGGTGLGLYVCKVIADAMGGSVGVNSKLNDGSTFWFTIPAALEGTEPIPLDKPPSTTYIRILPSPDSTTSSADNTVNRGAPFGTHLEMPEEEREAAQSVGLQALETTTQGGGRCYRGGQLLNLLSKGVDPNQLGGAMSTGSSSTSAHGEKQTSADRGPDLV